MFDLRLTQSAQTQLDRLKKDRSKSGLIKQVKKTLGFLQTNPRHPSLQTHPYHSLEHPYDPNQKVFEAYVQQKTPGAYRVFWCYGPQKRRISVIAITPHP
jgi:hypothetical protein